MQSLLTELDSVNSGAENVDFLFADGKYDVKEDGRGSVWGFYDKWTVDKDVFMDVNRPFYFNDLKQEPDKDISMSFSNVQNVVMQLIKRLAKNADVVEQSALSFLFAAEDEEFVIPIQVKTRIFSRKTVQETTHVGVYYLKMKLLGRDHWIKYDDDKKEAKTWLQVIDLYVNQPFIAGKKNTFTNFLIEREFYTNSNATKLVSEYYKHPKETAAPISSTLFAEYLRRAFDFTVFYLVYPLVKQFLARQLARTLKPFGYSASEKKKDIEEDILEKKLAFFRNNLIYRRTESEKEEANVEALKGTWADRIRHFNTYLHVQGTQFQWIQPRITFTIPPSYDDVSRAALLSIAQDAEAVKTVQSRAVVADAVHSLLSLLDDYDCAANNSVVEQAIETGCPSGASFVHSDACNVYGGGKNNNTWGTLRPWFAGLTKNEYGAEVPFFLTICGLQPFIKFFIERARKEKYDKGDATTLKKMKTEEKAANVTVDIYYLNNASNQTYFDSSFPITMKLKFYDDQLIYKTIQEGHKGNGLPGGISDKTVPYVASATFPKKLFRKAKSVDSWWAGSAAVDVFERIILNLVYPLVYVEFARKEAGTPFVQNIDNFLKDKVKREAWMSYVWSTQIITHNLANQRRKWLPSTNGDGQYQPAPARPKKYDVAPPKSSDYGYISVLGGMSSRVASSNEYESLVLKKPSGEEFSTTVIGGASETATSSEVNSIYAILASTRSSSSTYTAPEPPPPKSKSGYGQLPEEKTQ